MVAELSPPQRLLGGGEVDRGKRRCAWDDGKTERRSPPAFVYPLPSLQIAYMAKEYARAPKKREIGLCRGERWQKNTGLLVTFSRQKGVENEMSGDTRVFFEYLTILNENNCSKVPISSE